MRKINLKKIKPGDGVTSQRFGTGEVWSVLGQSIIVLYTNKVYQRLFLSYNQYGEQCDGTTVGVINGDRITMDDKYYQSLFKWEPFLESVAGASSAYSGVAIALALYEWLTNSVYLWSAIIVAIITLLTFVVSLFVLIKIDK